MPIKAIIFDFWGTLVEQGSYSPLKQSQQLMRVNLPFSEFVVRFEKAMFTKTFEDLASGFRAAYEEFGISPPEFVTERLIGLWNKNRLLAKLYPDTISALEELKKQKYKLVLVSNTDCFSIEPVLEKFGMTPLFDSITLSYKVGLLKTEPKLFTAIARELKLKKSELLMVGDSMESDIKGAEAAKIKAVLIDRRNTRDYKDKIVSLNELLAIVKAKK